MSVLASIRPADRFFPGSKESGRGRFFAAGLSVAGAILLATSSVGADAVNVGFDQASYQVAPGQAYSVNVVLPALPNGLFSYGIRLILPAGKALAAASDSVVVPAPLNFNGTAGAGALKEIGADALGVKGTVDFETIAASYHGTLLATFNLQNVAAAGQTYSLSLDLFRTLGATETLFVDGAGVPLDQSIALGSALVVVIPEPSTLSLLALPLLVRMAGRMVGKGERS